MADDIQTERFGESVANDSRNKNVLEALPVGNDSPYAPAGTATPTSKESGKKGCGCWVWGCAGLLIGSLLLMAGLGFGGYWYLTKQVEKYTDTEPDQIPAVEMEEEELQRLQDRIDSFSRLISPEGSDAEAEGVEPIEGLDGEEGLGNEEDIPVELVLTAREINALIHSNESLRGMVHVVIEDGNIQGKVSFPMDQIPGGKGRYFNADAELEVSMEDGILVVRLVDATVKGEPIPSEFIQPMKEQNFAAKAYDDPDTAEVLRKLESIEVIDDAIRVRLRQEEDPEPEDASISAERPEETIEGSSPSMMEEEAEAPLPF